MPSVLTVLLLTTLAVARISRLITTDKISEPARLRVAKRRPEGSQLTYLLWCPHCMSVWISAALTPAAWLLTDAPDHLGITSWFGLPAAALAVAYLASIIVTAETSR